MAFSSDRLGPVVRATVSITLEISLTGEAAEAVRVSTEPVRDLQIRDVVDAAAVTSFTRGVSPNPPAVLLEWTHTNSRHS